MRREKQITIERFRLPFRFAMDREKKPGESARFRAIVSAFGSIVDTSSMLGYRSVFRRGAFAKSIADWKSANPSRQRIKILDSHRQDAPPIGLPLDLRETDVGLELHGSLNETSGGRDWAAVLAHAAAIGQLSAIEFSIGFDALDYKMIEDETDGEMLREVTEARLWEASFVAAGADRQTGVLEAASLAAMLGTPRDFERHRARELEEIERFERELFAPRWSCVQ